MAVYKQARSNNWSYRFMWNGEEIRRSTKQTNKRVAEQMEAAHRTALAKGEVGIRQRVTVQTLREFATKDFLPFIEATFQAKPNTRLYYAHGVKVLLAFDRLAVLRLDEITTEHIAAFVAKRQDDGLEISTINRELQVLRRILTIAKDWGRVDKALPRVKMLSGERHRERVLTIEEVNLYLEMASSDLMLSYSDPRLLFDVACILLDCGLRPEECFRLRWERVRDGVIEIGEGKTANARRRIPITERVAAALEMRRASAEDGWVFPAKTRSGHMEPSTIRKQHIRACKGSTVAEGEWAIQPFPLYTMRHTCLTRWAPHMDPWTLHKLAGHKDMSITKRYVHPEPSTIKEAMERARRAHQPQPSHAISVTSVQ